MEETKISHKTAKLAKEKGFDVGSDKSFSYNEDGSVTRAAFQNYSQICYKVTQALLAKWLREIHNIYVEPRLESGAGYVCRVYIIGMIAPSFIGKIGDDYEDRLEEGLQEGLKLIKEEKDLKVSE